MKDEWQPIETAPKDGTIIDLWCVEKTEDGSFIYRRKTDCYWGVATFWGHDEVECWVNLYDQYKSWVPTHWMPISEGPKS